MDSKCKRKDQKRFQNVVNDPLITGDPDDLILGLVTLPELHIMIGMRYQRQYIFMFFKIGVLDKVLKELERHLFPGDEESGLAFIDTYLKKVIYIMF